MNRSITSNSGTSVLILIVITLISCGSFFSCTNSGKEYTIIIDTLNTRSDASIRALHVVDERIVWAGGSGGTFLLTTDGGNTWKSGIINGATDDEFRSVFAWDDEKAIVFGIKNPGRAYMTTTAGEDWVIVYENNSQGIFFNSLSFADEFRGIALSDPIDSTSFLVRTRDGGMSWQELENLPLLKEGEYNFAASNSCIDYHNSGMVWYISGGGAARLFRSEDHGENWEVFETGIDHSTPSSGIFSVNFIDDSTGVIVGGTYDKPELNSNIAAWSQDGGKSWNLSEIMPAEFRSSVIWLDDGKRRAVLSAGKTGFDYSTDGGKIWNFLTSEGYYTIRSVEGTLSGFAAGSEGRISRFRLVRR